MTQLRDSGAPTVQESVSARQLPKLMYCNFNELETPRCIADGVVFTRGCIRWKRLEKMDKWKNGKPALNVKICGGEE
jgi:hypothetical protein